MVPVWGTETQEHPIKIGHGTNNLKKCFVFKLFVIQTVRLKEKCVTYLVTQWLPW